MVQTRQKIYLDTNFYIYLLEDNPKFTKLTEFLAETITVSECQIVASTLIACELLVQPIKLNRQDLVDIYLNLEKKLTNFKWVNFSLSVAHLAAKLRAKYNIETPDSIHLATAISQSCTIYYTNDQNLKKVTEIQVEILS